MIRLSRFELWKTSAEGFAVKVVRWGLVAALVRFAGRMGAYKCQLQSSNS